MTLATYPQFPMVSHGVIGQPRNFATDYIIKDLARFPTGLPERLLAAPAIGREPLFFGD